MARHVSQFPQARHALAGLPTLASPTAWTPNTDVFETPETLVVRVELAGVARADLQITLSERVLLVRGHRPEPCRKGECRFRQMEIDYGCFERRILIPRPIDASRARAHFHNGFLHVELPKAATASQATVTVIIQQEA
ncbi:Hsp20/alpha crystallin family protein [bacterium]|nr:Hsp20/alpha crystallin family protein [bacterium]